MTSEMTTMLFRIVEIVWINLLLSGDNAIVIALACRGLPEHQRKLGTALGAGAAVVLRIIFALIVTQLLALPYLKFAGGLLLVWIGVKLVTDEEEHDVAAHSSLRQAVTTIAIADAVMSLDNVLAIVAAAKGSTTLVIFGLLISIPLVVAGSTLILKIIDRFPLLVWLGAALIGYVAGEILITDHLIEAYDDSAAFLMMALIICAPIVLYFQPVLKFILRYPTILWISGAATGWFIRTVADHPEWVNLLNSLSISSVAHYLPYFCAAYVVALAWLIKRKGARDDTVTNAA